MWKLQRQICSKKYHQLDRKCQIYASGQIYLYICISFLSNARYWLFLMCSTPIYMTRSLLMMLQRLITSKSFKIQHGKREKKKKKSKDRGHFLHSHMEPFHHFLCLSVDMKAAWWLLPFYCISPRVIAVSSLLFKRCQSAWTKWQPSGNWITEREKEARITSFWLAC